MKFLFISVFITTSCFIVKPFCFGQENDSSLQKTNAIAVKIKNELGQIVIQDSAHLFARGYLHLKGKIGNSNATIEINSFPAEIRAYVFCDSLKSINGFQVSYKKGILRFSNDDWLFTSGMNAINEINIAIKEDSTFVGYALRDSLHKEVKCVFKQNSSDGHIPMNQHSFNYKSQYKHFPVSLSECVLFADSSTTINEEINLRLLNEYDLIGQNYSEVMDKLSFANLTQYKNTKGYKKFCIQKFITAYKNIINKDFLEEARESGHTDIYLNSLMSEVIWNDGNYLVMQITMDYADGNAYPYYDTYLFEYDLKGNKPNSLDKLGEHIHFDDSKIQEIIANLKRYNLYDDSQSGDKWFLGAPQIAFFVEDGIVLYKTGGNHGIHYFYKYYPREVLAPILN